MSENKISAPNGTSNPSINISKRLLPGIKEDLSESKAESRKSSVTESKSFDRDSLQLLEDIFGQYYDSKGTCHSIKRFTWRNRNKIEVQVINYGARIISMKMPDRKGDVADIVLGFDDLAGYLYYQKHYFGAVIGRYSNIVNNSTFVIDKKQYWLISNHNNHHIHGGITGLDQEVWSTYITEKKVIMSLVSTHLSEGYPGDLLIRITFELTHKNEFSIHMDAQCTQPTIINLSNLTYFNLAGHYTGADEIYKHILTLNCNCFTRQVNGIPTGEIVNVVHTEFDFQIPKLLGKVMGITPKDGFDQNLCVNRAMYQDDCFIARILHPPSGRMLEVYSNQWGVNFSTANDFGYGRIKSMQELTPVKQEIKTPEEILDTTLCFFDKIHRKLVENLHDDERGNYMEMRNLITKLQSLSGEASTPHNAPERDSLSESKESKLLLGDFILTPLQTKYLTNILNITCEDFDEDDCDKLKNIIKRILDAAIQNEDKQDKIKNEENSRENCAAIKEQSTRPTAVKRKIPPENIIPYHYKTTNFIVGKGRKVYTMHGGIALQTQNYPGSANFKHFPNCILRPGEIYNHNITYKLWIRAGNPNKWIKRNLDGNKVRK